MRFTDIIAAFFAATLAAMGVGGGGLLVIYLVLVLNMTQHVSQGINLMFFIVANLFSLPYHAIKKRIRWREASVFAFLGTFGAVLGCIVSLKTEPRYVRTVFGVFLILAGGITFYKTVKEYFSNKKRKLL